MSGSHISFYPDKQPNYTRQKTTLFKALWSFETSKNTRPATQRFVAEEFNLQQHRSDNPMYGYNCLWMSQKMYVFDMQLFLY